ncbi:UDP-N-acetylmuramate dehydrogenase [Entomobacter blattae]|uniref:UDP-N-acetylenolpyruvoylglucosamine reductase n=1 Tax=Entomobacter blattae TaxID=2762277 RepID=A0A7H1NNS2_9PROT|nr:UDP-N-acetylmuramate dehydrogenase [Entomobacter blattae]QNT77432.1 UDP-N-acetylenolpyruvoylglucosamine reductase [Entomobacter blattae]
MPVLPLIKTEPFPHSWIADLLEKLALLKGRIKAETPLGAQTWFRVGGKADILIHPKDVDDLSFLMATVPFDIPVTILGASSNVIIRDGGIHGVVIRPLKGFADIKITDEGLIAGAACLDSTVAETAAKASLAGFEFLCSIPGSIGGAIAMNAGAHGADIASILQWIELVTREGKIIRLEAAHLNLAYRHASLPAGAVVTKACFNAQRGNSTHILAKMADIRHQREISQPIHSRTGGSTFRNPLPEESLQKAWELIDAAGCRGLTLGDAQISPLHCNFMINTGNATAHDLETLGETVREKVKNNSGITLHWEIKRIGHYQKEGL